MFFGIVRLFGKKFLPEFFFTKGTPFKFFDVLQQWKLKNAIGSPLLALAGTWRASSVVWVFREFDTLFTKFDTLSFLTFSCPFAIFEP